jgi:Adenylate and Guanylate cyclase catalytic domain
MTSLGCGVSHRERFIGRNASLSSGIGYTSSRSRRSLSIASIAEAPARRSSYDTVDGSLPNFYADFDSSDDHIGEHEDDSIQSSDFSEDELNGGENNCGHPLKEADSKVGETIAQSESRQIYCLQVFATTTLVLATMLTAVALYYNLRLEETEQFEAQFQDHAVKTIDGSLVHLQKSLTALDNLGVAYTSYASFSEEAKFPFVTLPDFNYLASSVGGTTKTKLISFLPVVSNADRDMWEKYALGSMSRTIQNPVNQPSTKSSNVFAVAKNSDGRERQLETNRSDSHKDQYSKGATDSDNDNPQPDGENGPRDGSHGATSLSTSSPAPGSSDGAEPDALQGDRSETIEKPGATPVVPSPPPSQVLAPTHPPESAGSPSLSPAPSFGPSHGYTVDHGLNPGVPMYMVDLPRPEPGNPVQYYNNVSTTIFRMQGAEMGIVESIQEYYLPVWQSMPLDPKTLNYNLLSHPMFEKEVNEVLISREAIIGKSFVSEEHSKRAEMYPPSLPGNGSPCSILYIPVFSSLRTPRNLVGIVTGLLNWTEYVRINLEFSTTEAIVCVVENTCGQQYTWKLDGKEATFMGKGDHHDRSYTSMVKSFNLTSLATPRNNETSVTVSLEAEYCPYSIRIYPTRELEDTYVTNKPLLYTTAAVVAFLFTVLVLLLLAYLQEKRHKLVLETAVQSSAVVSSLFPAVVRDRMFQGDEGDMKPASATRRLKSYLTKGKKRKNDSSKQPIADLFPECTVMFADISGFTAWSSVREPHQVFTLLETIYRAFDYTARKRNVFKVETIGDCYVCRMRGASISLIACFDPTLLTSASSCGFFLTKGCRDRIARAPERPRNCAIPICL